MTHKKINTIHFISFLLMALFYFFIAFCVPYCHDDWDWGLDIGMTQWLEASLNSRYGGSFFVIIMTRSPLLKTIIMGITLFAIPLLITLLSGTFSLSTYLFSNLAMLIIPKLMWQQTYGWVSAFSNFVISAALFLLLLFLLEQLKKGPAGWQWLLPPLTLLLMLFSENITIFFFLFLCFFIIAQCFLQKKIATLSIFLWLFAFFGLIIMFSNGLYSALLSDGTALSGIRSMAIDLHAGFFSIVQSILQSYFIKILPPLFFCHPWLILLLVFSLVLKGTLEKKPSVFYVLLSLFSLVCSLFFFISWNHPFLPSAISLVFLLLLGALIWKSFPSPQKTLLYFICALGVLAPLVMVTEIGPRLYFLPYVFLTLIATTATAQTNFSPNARRLILCLIGLFLALSMLFYSNIYREIHSVTQQRAQAIKTAIEEEALVVHLSPDNHPYWWGRNPASPARLEFFKEFYKIPSSMEVIFDTATP